MLLKQQSTGGHVLHSQHIILILSQPVFVLTLYCCDRSRESTNINVIVFGLTPIQVIVTSIFII